MEENGTQPFTSVNVVALLAKVIQEQQKKIAVLAKEVEGLKKGRM